MDIEHAVADFAASDCIKSLADLETALSSLLVVVAKSDAEVSALLNSLACSVQGLLETVLLSGNHHASKFRTRVLKETRKSEAQAFRTTVERLGAFFLELPPEVVVDRGVAAAFNPLMNTLKTLSNTQISSQAISQSSEAREQPKLGKKKQRNTSGSQAPRGSTKKPPADSSLLFKASDQMTTFLENVFEYCSGGEIEQFALNNVLSIVARNVSRSSPLESKALERSSPIADKFSLDGRARSNSLEPSYFPLGFDDIAHQLEKASGHKSGDWPLVIAQRAIKHIKEVTSYNNDMSPRIEKKIKQLSVGYFPPPNQANLFDGDTRPEIYTADLGDNFHLVYQIDFGAPVNKGQESQFIRIFDMLPKAEIDTKFWRSVAAQLARRGEEYMRRCSDRAETRIRFKRVETTPPKVFPPLGVSQWKDGADFEANEEYFMELHRVLALEKFIPYSQKFFDAIRKHDETNFVFAVSSTENQIINHNSSCIVLGRSGTGKTTCLLFRMLALDIAAEKCGRPVRQMFVTQSLKLANQVRSQFLQMRQTEADSSTLSDAGRSGVLSLQELEEKTAEGVLPSKFSQLNDSHFPLFLTFDQLCKLLAADYDLNFDPSSTPAPEGLPESTRGPLISFEYFQAKIWPRIDGRLKKGLHSTLAYNEFMGVIKGSEASLKVPKRHLDRDSYETLSSRSRSRDEAERSKIYTLFEIYLKLRPPPSYDVADRAHILLDALQEKGVPGKYLDFLYVDEVQDNLVVDAALLKFLCPNPHGLFFAGDTAQIISAGSTFRFNELKSILYSLEREEINVRRGTRKPIDPHFFQLSTNYRSHSGIVDAAAFTVSLIDSYFPHSIDSLAPEVSIVDVSAHKPVFLSGRNNSSDFLQFISHSSNGVVGLGAQQVIIVRDEVASQRLQESIGEVAIVLTLYESKGMEFDDVLLYNFFSDSPATATDWRGLLRAQQESIAFDERRHSILQSELKSLYVGLTRARERVWVWDCSEKGRDMEALLVASHIATSHTTQIAIPQIGVLSPLEEWRDRAQQFFVEKLFPEAALCFAKAGLFWWAKVARAYHERQTMVRLRENGLQPASALVDVGRMFDALAGCVENEDDRKSSQVLFSNAGECYAMGPDHKAAADAFLKAEKYTESAHHYLMAGLLDTAMEIVTSHHIEQQVSEAIKYAAKIACARKGDVVSLHQARKLCKSKDEFIRFLGDHGFEEEQITFLESVGDYVATGQLLWERGDYISALLQFRRSETSVSQSKASECLLEALRAQVPLGENFEELSQPLLELLSLSEDTDLSYEQRDEVELLHAVATGESEELETHGLRCHKSGDHRGVVLALYNWASSDGLSALDSDLDTRVVQVLALYLALGKSISVLAESPRITEDLALRQLFGVSTRGNAEYRRNEDLTVHPNSFIYQPVLAFHRGSDNMTSMEELHPVTVPKSVVEDLIRSTLLANLKNKIDSLEILAKRSRAFELCSRYSSTGRCLGADEGYCWRDHIAADEFTIQKFNMKLRLTLLLIRVLDLSLIPDDEFDTERSRILKQRTWLARFFRLCYPPSVRLGSIADITPALIPGYSEAIHILKFWLREVSERLRPSDQERFFLTQFLSNSLLATALDHTEALYYLREGLSMLDMEIDFEEEWRRTCDIRSSADTALSWFSRSGPLRTHSGVIFLENLMDGQFWLDMDVAVSFAEEVCGQLILNAYAHQAAAYHGLTMPRSWILRAFFRGSSIEPNGDLPLRLVAALGGLLHVLLLKKDSGRFMLEGIQLEEVSMGARNHVIGRLCRCLTLVGQNIRDETLRTKILVALKGVNYFSGWSSLHKYSTARTWTDAVAAMTSLANRLCFDEIVTISWKGSVLSSALGQKIFCSDEKSILENLTIIPQPPAIISLMALARRHTSTARAESGQQDWNLFEDIDASEVYDEGWTYEERWSASIIEAFFRRHHRPSGGAIVLEFQKLAKRRILAAQLPPPNGYWLICVRGPLPHAFGYLQRLEDISTTVASSIQNEMHLVSRKGLDRLRAKASEIRAARKKASDLIKLLQPSSDFYLPATSSSAPSVFDIVDKIRLIPNLIASIRKFAPCPEDDDYALGVEPLLSDRVPWGWAKSEGQVLKK